MRDCRHGPHAVRWFTRREFLLIRRGARVKAARLRNICSYEPLSSSV